MRSARADVVTLYSHARRRHIPPEGSWRGIRRPVVFHRAGIGAVVPIVPTVLLVLLRVLLLLVLFLM